jgi:hypothetical protein
MDPMPLVGWTTAVDAVAQAPAAAPLQRTCGTGPR